MPPVLPDNALVMTITGNMGEVHRFQGMGSDPLMSTSSSIQKGQDIFALRMRPNVPEGRPPKRPLETVRKRNIFSQRPVRNERFLGGSKRINTRIKHIRLVSWVDASIRHSGAFVLVRVQLSIKHKEQQ